MAQLININSTGFRRCNLSAIQSGGTWASLVPDENEIILISTTNSLTAGGSGECDAYIKGDGATAASGLTITQIDKDILSLIPDGYSVIANPASAQQDIYIKANGTTASSNGWFISEPISLKKGETISGTGRGNSCA